MLAGDRLRATHTLLEHGHHVVAGTRSHRPDERVQLATDLTEPLPAVVADPGQLEQVLVNLAVNARDAMPAGGHLTVDTGLIHLTEGQAEARDGLRPGHYVRIRVSDTGILCSIANRSSSARSN